MAITGAIPIGKMPVDYLTQGTGAINDILQKARTAALQRQQMEEMAKFHGADLAMREKSLAASHAMDPLRQKILEEQLTGLHNKNDPNYEIDQIKRMMGAAGGGEGDENGPPDFSELKKNPLVRGLFKKKFGIDIGAETPEEKRQNDLQKKLEFENKKVEQKEMQAVEKDIPTLQESVKGVQDLLKIARENPDMFGHGFLPDRYAKTSKNKNFGTWQNLIADRIAGLESKLSSRGNIVALKMASQLKPSHADQQQVAIGKLESMLGQLNRQLQNSMKKAGKMGGEVPKFADEDMVVVEGPNGEETMTYAQAKALGAE
jgi:hypothetical protein